LTSVRRQIGDALGRDESGQLILAFEVICPNCGDDGGAYADQPPAVQAVRGPYRGVIAARAAAHEHTGGG
jgi:hypothetical protein